MNVGDVVTNKIKVLGNDPETRGVVYEIYADFDDPREQGVSVIFKNGEYDGFSHEDQKLFLNEESVPVPYWIRDYQFTNVMKLSQDFRNGFWDEIFQ